MYMITATVTEDLAGWRILVKVHAEEKGRMQEQAAWLSLDQSDLDDRESQHVRLRSSTITLAESAHDFLRRVVSGVSPEEK